jgi:hypothetical protein
VSCSVACETSWHFIAIVSKDRGNESRAVEFMSAFKE